MISRGATRSCGVASTSVALVLVSGHLALNRAAADAPAQSSSGGGGDGGSERRSRFRRICVYCGSAKGKKASYQDAAIDLGNQLVRMPPSRA